jgi:hypothetical protein
MPEQQAECRLRVDFSALPPQEAKELFGAIALSLPNASFSPDGVQRRSQVFAWHPGVISFLVPATIYAGKKAIDLMADFVKRWMEKKLECTHRTVMIYGPDNEIVKVLECELKQHDKK